MKKILIISSNRLGDCILSSGVIEFYKKKFKEVKIVFVCGIVPSYLFSFFKNISIVIPLKKKKYSLHWLFLWTKVFFNFWDCVIDLRGTGISYFLLAKKRLLYSGHKKEIKKHKVISISKIITNKILDPFIDISEDHLKTSKNIEFIKKINIRSDLIAIAPSANWSGKKWPSERYSELIRRLIKLNIFVRPKFLLFGSESEYQDSQKIFSCFKKNEIINLSGILKLNEIFIIMRYCKLFIGNDSGLMHLSAASKIPTVGLFGPSDIVQYHPWGKTTLSISTPESPDDLMNHKNFSHKNTNSLMLGLTVKVVENNIIKFYKNIQKNSE